MNAETVNAYANKSTMNSQLSSLDRAKREAFGKRMQHLGDIHIILHRKLHLKGEASAQRYENEIHKSTGKTEFEIVNVTFLLLKFRSET